MRHPRIHFHASLRASETATRYPLGTVPVHAVRPDPPQRLLTQSRRRRDAPVPRRSHAVLKRISTAYATALGTAPSCARPCHQYRSPRKGSHFAITTLRGPHTATLSSLAHSGRRTTRPSSCETDSCLLRDCNAVQVAATVCSSFPHPHYAHPLHATPARRKDTTRTIDRARNVEVDLSVSLCLCRLRRRTPPVCQPWRPFAIPHAPVVHSHAESPLTPASHHLGQSTARDTQRTYRSAQIPPAACARRTPPSRATTHVLFSLPTRFLTYLILSPPFSPAELV
ncbi:hypothetical protein B0H14DRAFT_3877874, partial [Mycena olivaceomarginata]